MPLNVPDVGENDALEYFTNRAAPQNLVLKLYKNNITPADTDTAATYTEATFTGYVAITLTGASWSAPAAGSISYSAQQSFTASAGSQTDDIYGYFCIRAASLVLAYSERDPSAPFAIRNNGDNVKITPTITAS